MRRFTYVSVFRLAFEYVRATYSSMPSLAQLEERQTVMVAVASECRPFEPGRKESFLGVLFACPYKWRAFTMLAFFKPCLVGG